MKRSVTVKPMGLHILQFVALTVVGVLFTASVAKAVPISAVTVGAGGTTTNTGDWAAGWEFTVSQTIQVTDLGKFDFEADGIVGTDVGLYDSTAGGTMLTSASLVGASFELSGVYRAYYTAITPVTLTPGNTYTIVAVQDGPAETIFWGSGLATTYASGITYAGGVASSGASLPATFTSNAPNPGSGYFGGTFKFEAVPEPASLTLLGMGALGGLAMLRRRK